MGKPPRQRRRLLAEAVREHGWSRTLALRLAAEWGISETSIYRDWSAIRDDLEATPAPPTPSSRQTQPLPELDDETRRALLEEIEQRIEDAAGAEEHGPVASLLRLKAQVLGADRPPPPPPPEVEEVEIHEDPLDDLLDDLRSTRRLLRIAERREGLTAAERLLRREAELKAQIRAIWSQRREADLDSEEDAAIVSDMYADLIELPPPLLDALVARLIRYTGGIGAEA